MLWFLKKPERHLACYVQIRMRQTRINFYDSKCFIATGRYSISPLIDPGIATAKPVPADRGSFLHKDVHCRDFSLYGIGIEMWFFMLLGTGVG